MIIEANVTSQALGRIMILDEIELDLKDNFNGKITRLKVVVKSFIKEEEKCPNCGINLSSTPTKEYMRKIHCADCADSLKRKKEELQNTLIKAGRRKINSNSYFGKFSKKA